MANPILSTFPWHMGERAIEMALGVCALLKDCKILWIFMIYVEYIQPLVVFTFLSLWVIFEMPILFWFMSG